ncbi:MAG: phosphoribosylglycinamide formyltransferase [Draconibacterium sp.]
MKTRKIAVFASGSGTNAQNIFSYFSENQNVIIDSLWSNNPNAYALERARNFGVETFVFTKNEFVNSSFVSDKLRERGVDLVVLAGFLWLIPSQLISTVKIINIHPALLPKYGGKGMYGAKVHEAVVANREKESGITIHYVNEKYDEGTVIFQAKCELNDNDTPDDVASKVHQLEYQYYPEVILKILTESFE